MYKFRLTDFNYFAEDENGNVISARKIVKILNQQEERIKELEDNLAGKTEFPNPLLQYRKDLILTMGNRLGEHQQKIKKLKEELEEQKKSSQVAWQEAGENQNKLLNFVNHLPGLVNITLCEKSEAVRKAMRLAEIPATTIGFIMMSTDHTKPDSIIQEWINNFTIEDGDKEAKDADDFR